MSIFLNSFFTEFYFTEVTFFDIVKRNKYVSGMSKLYLQICQIYKIFRKLEDFGFVELLSSKSVT